MCNTIKTLSISVTICLVLFGCTSESDYQEQAPKSQTPSPAPQIVPVAPSQTTPIVPATPSRTTASISLADITLMVTMQGTLQPGAEIDVRLVQTSGSPINAIRLWVGNESGVGSAKTKSHSHGASHHAIPQAPNPLPANSALWIEVESAMGERESGSIALN